MKFLIVDINYNSFLQWFYTTRPGAESLSYAEQWRALMDLCFGTADFYSSNLRKLGHEAHEVIANNEPLQRQWALENDIKLRLGWLPSFHFHFDKKWPPLRVKMNRRWLFQALAAQIQTFDPDVLYIQDVGWIPNTFLKDMKRHVGIVIGQHATSLPAGNAFDGYDLILSSLPNVVAYFRKHGVASEYFRLGFEQEVLQKLTKRPTMYDIVHIGGYGPIHNERNVLLQKIARRFNVDFWGYGIGNLPSDSPIRGNYHGEAWGLEMYNIRRNSKIILNKHITSVASRFCNNCTLYEATGVGTLLITDYKDNLHELFELGHEVIAYRNAEECAELIEYYLTHEDERTAIANAGQQRTLREHTYYRRMQELIDIIVGYI